MPCTNQGLIRPGLRCVAGSLRAVISVPCCRVQIKVLSVLSCVRVAGSLCAIILFGEFVTMEEMHLQVDLCKGSPCSVVDKMSVLLACCDLRVPCLAGCSCLGAEPGLVVC